MDIIIYTTPTCPRCKILKNKLNEKNIEFTECQDIDTMAKLGIMEVPKLEKNNELFSFGEAVAWVNSL